MLIKALAAAAGNFGGGYNIEDSLRFNDNDSAYLSRTPASAGNRRTWTWSGWVKRGNVGINGYLFGADTAAGSGDGFGFISSDQLKVYVNGAVTGDLVTNALFRDVGGWYHLVVSADSTQATASNRIKVYVNGEQVTSFATETYPPQNFDFDINGVFAHWLGRVYVYYFDGYMAEINFVDGQALTADDFGEINADTGEWSPKKYSGTYGTNGFYLKFSDGFVGQDSRYETTFADDFVTYDTNIWDESSSTSGASFYSNSQRLQVQSYGSNTGGYHGPLAVATLDTPLDDFEFRSDVYIGNTSGDIHSTAIYLRDANDAIIASFSHADAWNDNDPLVKYYFNNGSTSFSQQSTSFDANIRIVREGSAMKFYVNEVLKWSTTEGNANPVAKISINIRQYQSYPVPLIYIDSISIAEIGGNSWTPINISQTDQMLDTPTNNFATLNSITNAFWITNGTVAPLQEGNLLVTATDSPDQRDAAGTIGISSGKWYWEIVVLTKSGTSAWSYGVVSEDTGIGYLYYAFNGNKFISSVSNTSYAASWDVNDIMGIAFDADAGTVTFYKNNASQGVAFTGLSGTFLPLSMALGGSNYTVAHNFGADSSFAGNKTRQGNTDANGIGDFYYTPPTGYLALCTDNLAEPAIVDSETQFNVVTYTGNSADRNIDVGFEADFVWLKRRDSAPAHRLYDSVRGNGKALFSNLTNAEYDGVNDGVHFDYANGFNIDVGLNVESYNETGGSYVAWCWKAGGTAVTNTDGSITSSVSANVDAGFSVVGHTGNGVDEATIGHGLSQAPDMIITKNRDSAVDWRVYHSSLPTDYLLRLNLTNAQATNVTNGWIHNVTSTTFAANNYSGIAGVNSSGVDYIHYCFHSVEGFSKFGSYTGNGSTNGPFVYTGFRPAFVIVKRTDAAGYNWVMFDSARDPDNVVQYWLYPNLSSAEAAANRDDMYSNGFKIRQSGAGINASGGTYIYMAFAESPTKFSLGR